MLWKHPRTHENYPKRRSRIELEQRKRAHRINRNNQNKFTSQTPIWSGLDWIFVRERETERNGWNVCVCVYLCVLVGFYFRRERGAHAQSFCCSHLLCVSISIHSTVHIVLGIHELESRSYSNLCYKSSMTHKTPKKFARKENVMILWCVCGRDCVVCSRRMTRWKEERRIEWHCANESTDTIMSVVYVHMCTC